jgi:hypothetical protein
MSDVEKINLVSIDVLKTNIIGIDNLKLLEEIAGTYAEIDPSFIDDKHHTYYEDRKYPFGMIESEKLIDKLSERVSAAIGKEMVLSDIWTLSLEFGQSVSAHSHKSNTHLHPEEYFSIAYYPSAPEGSADLIFLVNAGNTIENSVEIKPKTGDLVIFNSYLTHMTNRHKNKKEARVVVSANFAPKNPNVKSTQDWSAYSRCSEGKNGEYIKLYHLKVHTPFGKEDVNLGIKKNVAEVFNSTGIYFIESFNDTDTSFEASFSVDTPAIADITIRFSVDEKNGDVMGSAKIGEFAEYSIVGYLS